jgi:hypothetical protein
MSGIRIIKWIVTLSVAMFLYGTAFGQAVNNAQIHGIVQDPTGAAVSGAQVKATQLDTGHTQQTISGADGAYTLPGLPIGGAYSIEVTASGFETYKQSGIVLTVGSNVEVNTQVGVGTVSQQVQVNSDASMVQTQDTSISETIDSKRIVDLPLNGRQATDLIALTGGAASPPNAASRVVTTHDYQSSLGVSIMGGQINGNNYILDGGDHNDSHSNVNMPFPFPDALQEFTVQSSGVSARFGLHPGSVINALTKSGTNQIHGTVFEFIRNGAVNAKGYFATAPDPLKRNQYGGTIGGPLIHNKIFLFGGTQETAIRTAPSSSVSFIPTPAMLAGDFSQCSTIPQLYDPVTHAALPGNKVNPNRFVTPALNVVKLLPTSTDPCGKVTYGVPNPSNEIQAVGKVDVNINSHHTFLARYFMLDYSNPAIFTPGNILSLSRAALYQRAQSITLGEQYIINPYVINNLHFTYSRLAVNRTNAPELQNSAQLGVNMYNAPDNYTYISVSSAFNYSGSSNSPASFIRNQWQYSDDVDWIYHKNHFSFGFENIIGQMDQTNIQNENGAFTFSGVATGPGGGKAGFAMADFLLGDLTTLAVNNIVVNGLRQKYIGAYIQDDIQFSPRVTFHAGVRWEPSLPEYDSNHDQGNHINIASLAANQRTQVFKNAPAGIFFYGDPGIPKAYTHGNYANLAPRIGIAIDPDGKGVQSIRSSFGIFFDQPESYTMSAFGIGPPWANGLSLTSPAGGFVNPFASYPGGDPFPYPSPPTANAAFSQGGTFVNLPLGLTHPYMEAWSLSYQRQLGHNWIFSADYVGNRGVHFRGATEANPAIYAPGATTATTQARRYFNTLNATAGPYYSTVTQMDDHINTYYEGLRISAQHRLAQKYTLLAVYTYSKCLQSAETLGNKLQGNTESDPYYRENDFGLCDFDLRHNFVASFVYEGYHFQNRALDTVLGGWSPAFIVSDYRAFPFSVTTGTDVSLSGVGLDRPNVVPGVNPYNQHLGHAGSPTWITKAAFTTVPGAFGNSRMNGYSGPGYVDVDTTIVKNVRTWREQQLQLRFETFNIFNHTNFAAPISAYNSTQFGQIITQQGTNSSSTGQRILQGAIKYTF